jgi:dTDP-4-dehydrorhamnose reductase
MINVLVLGITGMLGSMVFRYLSLNEKLNILGTSRELSSLKDQNTFQLDANNITEEYLLKLISKTNPDYIINCIVINKSVFDNQEGIQNNLN